MRSEHTCAIVSDLNSCRDWRCRGIRQRDKTADIRFLFPPNTLIGTNMVSRLGSTLNTVQNCLSEVVGYYQAMYRIDVAHGYTEGVPGPLILNLNIAPEGCPGREALIR